MMTIIIIIALIVKRTRKHLKILKLRHLWTDLREKSVDYFDKKLVVHEIYRISDTGRHPGVGSPRPGSGPTPSSLLFGREPRTCWAAVPSDWGCLDRLPSLPPPYQAPQHLALDIQRLFSLASWPLFQVIQVMWQELVPQLSCGCPLLPGAPCSAWRHHVAESWSRLSRTQLS